MRRACAALVLSVVWLCWAQSPEAARDAGKLPLNQPVERSLGPGQTDLFTLEIPAGMFASVTIRKSGVDAAIKIVDPSGKILMMADSANGFFGPVKASTIAEAAGTYSVKVIKSPRTAETGKYEIELTSLGAPSETNRKEIQAETTFYQAAAKERTGDRASRLASLQLYEQAEQQWLELGDHYNEAVCLQRLGAVNYTLSENQKALQYYEQALTKRRAAGDRVGEAATLTGIGVAYSALGDDQKSIDYYQQALPIRRATGDLAGEATTLNSLGISYAKMSENQKALEYYQQSLEIKRALGDRPGQALTIHNIGILHALQGEKQTALEDYRQSYEINRATGDRMQEANDLIAMAAVYADLGENLKGLDSYQQALPLSRAVGDRIGEAYVLNGMGMLHFDIGEAQQALDQFQQALVLERATGARSLEGSTLDNLGNAYHVLGAYEKALDSYQQALTIQRAVRYRNGEAIGLTNVGLIYAETNNPRKAVEYYQQALPIEREIHDRNREASTLNSLGEAYVALGENQKALESFQQSLPIATGVGDRSAEAACLSGFGSVYSALGQKQQALDSYSQSWKLYAEVRYKQGEAQTQFRMASLQRELGDLDRARTLAANAREVSESLRAKVVSEDLKTSYFASVQRYYGLEIDVLMDLRRKNPSGGYDSEALQASERSRARTLLEMLREAHADIRQGVDPALPEKERVLQAQLNAKELDRTRTLGGKHTAEQAAEVEKAVNSLSNEYQDIEAQIRARSPRYAALSSPQPLNLAAIQKEVLDSDTILLEYAMGEDRGYLWVVSPASITGFVLPKRDEVEEATRAFYDGITKPGTAASASGKALSHVLLGDAAPLLAGKRLLIVADGALQYLPFQALPDPDGSGEPLVVHHEVVNAPSASTIAILRRENQNRKPAPKLLAILADPVFSTDDSRLSRGQERAATPATRDMDEAIERSMNDIGMNGARLSRLPGTRREAAGIVSLVPTEQRKEALDFEASRETVMSPEMDQYRMLHFATHGLLNSVHPELSGLVFSMVNREGVAEDGFLRLNEIYNLKLSADLVVLSACQTGLGKETRGEGLVGLTRGFMYAGAPRVVASLWKVDDRATAELMKQFYAAMLGKESLRPAAALRAAQIQMAKTKEFADPYYWAAFTLQGEWR
jgi:CHAT domain-containing protein